MTIPYTLSTSHTVYSIAKHSNNSYARLIASITDQRFFFGANEGNFATFYGSSSWHDVAANTPAGSVSSNRILGVVNNGSTAFPYFDGTAQNTKTGTTSADSQLTIFSGIGQFWSGPCGEIVITNNVLSTIDRQKLEGYLAHKWGLTSNLPESHPHKLVAPNLF